MLTKTNSPLLHPVFNFNDLSVSDLIEARDLFHVHLMNKKNVVATAVGRYRIRKNEPWPNQKRYAEKVKQKNKPKRTIHNSEVREYSWPAILVFVKEWLDEKDFGKVVELQDLVPKQIYMPDGRIVPICVIEATKDEYVEEYPDPSQIIFPTNYIGGGFPLIVQSQGVQRIASIGCVVTDGNKYYALTNKHVVGEPGTIIYTKLKGILTPIGKSAEKQIGNSKFDTLFEGWKSSNLYINVDVGLIEIDDITLWKTDVFGVGSFDQLADINTYNLSLNLIGSQVCAFGSVSGRMDGEIAALFYRYKSVGGYEYAADFLIGPTGRATSLPTRHGDSGTLWMLKMADEGKTKDSYLPIALQWGKHSFIDDGEKTNSGYALASCLSNILKTLEVDLVRGWNIANDYSWGKLGHFSIANLACNLIKNRKLKQLIKNNLEIITFGYDDLTIKKIDSGLKLLKQDYNFAPLADVPDLVWKARIAGVKRGSESPNHFADMDTKDSSGETLLDKCTGSYKNMKYLTPEEWLAYYTDEKVQDGSKGILPFRVWQIFKAMVEYVTAGNVVSFFTAAGILAHYVGDACQPLHISYMFDGIPASDGTKKGEHVHSLYETNMINRHISEILDEVKTVSSQAKYKQLIQISSGKEAAGATVQLMKNTFKLIEPKSLVDIVIKYKDKKGLGDAAVADKLWDEAGKGSTGGIFMNGAHCLASLWEGAWLAANGNKNIQDLGTVNIEDVVETYLDQDFIPSVSIKKIRAYM